MKAIHVQTPWQNEENLNRGFLAMTETFEGAAVVYCIDGGLALTVPKGFEPEAICDVLVEAEIIDPTRDSYEIREF